MRIPYNKLVIEFFNTIPLIASIALMSELWLGDGPNETAAESLGWNGETSLSGKIHRSQIRRGDYSFEARPIQECKGKTRWIRPGRLLDFPAFISEDRTHP